MQNFTGRLLIASPHLTDGNFLRTVLFIVRHDSDGALGFILNRRTNERLSDAVDWSSEGSPIRQDDHLYSGGPVEGPLVTLHDVPGIGQPCGIGEDQSTIKIEDHPAEAFGELSLTFDPAPVWLTADEDHARILARRTDSNVRFMSGYSGWGPRQLDHEYDTGGWLHLAADEKLIFGDVNDMWEICVKRCGREVLEVIDDQLHFDDPQRN